MAKVVFLQQLAEEWLGIMYISSILKSHGHQCDVYVEPLEKEDVATKALSQPADIVAFSCLASDFHWALQKAEIIKKKSDALIVFGGTHVTLNPDEVIQNHNIDIICRGEGEYPMLELADAIDRKGDFSGIENLWIKRNGTVVKNEMRRLLEDLDSLPFPDRKLYAKYSFFEKRGKRPLHLGRGCPYRCSYCHNSSKQLLFKGKGKFIRWRNMESVLAEVAEIKRGFVTVLHFIDDGFGINIKWLKQFVEKLAKMEGKRLAIQANMRADMVTENLCEILREYGADLLRIRIAVECGDEEYRRDVLKKSVSNEDLIRASDLFRNHGIDFITYNMIGLPGETLDQALETLLLNIRLKPAIAICFVYQPYPGTDLAEYALQNGFLAPDMIRKMGTSLYRGFYSSASILTQKDIRKAENLQRVFSTTARHSFLFPLVKQLVRIEAISPLLRLVYSVFVRGVLYRRKMRDKY